MVRFVHAEGIRERANTRTAPANRDLIHRCRSCYAGFQQAKETCPKCGYVDEHSTHGATNAEVRADS